MADALYWSSKNLIKLDLFTEHEVAVITNIYENHFKYVLGKENPLFDEDKFNDYIRGL